MDPALQICFTCLSTDTELIKYENIDRNIAAFYERFVADDSQMHNVTQNQNYLCENCAMQLKNSYCFWRQCMHSKSRLENYISELESQNRNYYEMQPPPRNNNVVVKSEEGENIVLMELGNAPQSHLYQSTSNSDSFPIYHNFEGNQSFPEDVIKTERDDAIQYNSNEDLNMHDMNMDYIVTEGDVTNTNIDKEKKELNKPFQCNICQHKFVNKGNLKRHLLLIHSDKPTSKHSSENGESGTYQCEYCPKKLLTKNNLLRHTQKHTGEQAFHCKTCPKTFTNKAMCLRHEETHTQLTIYECDICKTEYTNLEEFKNHRNSHETNLKCENCSKIFDTEQDLNKHKESCENNKRTFPCPNCDKIFKSNQKLQRHVLTHEGSSSLKCMYNNCDKTFSDRLSFKEHTKTHINLKNLECQTCSKKFLTETKLKDHENTHLGLKPYECMICQKLFSHASSLDTHLKTHSGEDRPFKCGICPKSYLSKSALKFHEDVHKNESYNCNDCNLQFNSRSSLYRHFKSHKATHSDKSS